MAESAHCNFVRPRELLSATRIDFVDAINLVIYAKLPLLTALKGRRLIAGYLLRDEIGGARMMRSFRGDKQLLDNYARQIDRLTFPVSPSLYEPLLDQISRANEYALPYFFHEHHLMVDRRRRAALFGKHYKLLQGEVTKGSVKLQVTEADDTSILLDGAWMTSETLRAYLHGRGVLPWWGNEENIHSHLTLERVFLHDWLSHPRAGVDEQEETRRRSPEFLRENRVNLREWLGRPSEPRPDQKPAAQDQTNALRHGDSDSSAAAWSSLTGDFLPGQMESPQPHLSQSTNTTLEAPIELILPPVPPEQEPYDEQQLPSFLLAEKLIKQMRVAADVPQEPPTSYTQHYSPIRPIVLVDSHKQETPVQVQRLESSADADPNQRARASSFEGRQAGELATAPAPGYTTISESSTSESDGLSDESMLSKKQIAGLLSVSPNTVDNYRKLPGFPKEHEYGANTIRWKRSEILQWRDQRQRK